MPNILERLSQGPVLGDGGYLIWLEGRGLVSPTNYAPTAVARAPEEVKKLHQEFVDAGSEVLQAFGFYATRNKLAHALYEKEYEQINRDSVRLAREVAQAAPRPVLVAGNISSTSVYDTNDPSLPDRIRAQYADQVRLQMEGKPDFFIAEYFHRIAEALLALEAIKKTNLPTMITITISEGRIEMNDGTTPEEAARILKGDGADIVGMNCDLSPEEMLPLAERLRRAVEGPIASQPMGDIPNTPGSTLPPERLARFAQRARDAGIWYIGCCCGAGPPHVKAMAEALGK